MFKRSSKDASRSSLHSIAQHVTNASALEENARDMVDTCMIHYLPVSGLPAAQEHLVGFGNVGVVLYLRWQMLLHLRRIQKRSVHVENLIWLMASLLAETTFEKYLTALQDDVLVL